MKNYLKSLGLLASVFLELIGLLLLLMQYKVVSEDIVFLTSAIAVGVLITFGFTTFIQTIRNSTEQKQQPHTKLSIVIVIFWVLLASSLIMMTVTNVLAFVGFNYNSIAVLVTAAIWGICFIIAAIMYLSDFVVIDDKEQQRREHLKKIQETFFSEEEEVDEE